MNNFTFLTKEQVYGDNKLEIIRKYGSKCSMTDYAILLGCNVYSKISNTLNSSVGWWWTQSLDSDEKVIGIGNNGKVSRYVWTRDGGVRPALPYSSISSFCSPGIINANGILEVEYGEYPQTVVDDEYASELEHIWFNCGLKATGKRYTSDDIVGIYEVSKDIGFQPKFNNEYEYKGNKYVRINYAFCNSGCVLSNGEKIKYSKTYWVRVEPIVWLVDEIADIAITKKIILSGIQFSQKSYNGNFDKSDIQYFMKNYFAKEIVDLEDDYEDDEEFEEIANPYGLVFDEVDEEDIIKGAIQSGVAVFLHGPSSEGKSARVKELDPTCETIYLRNATPESLNGKSVYNSETGKMIDIKPTWLKKVEEKCQSEPDKLHIVFFDELTNALPSIQGIAFNIVLDREVNGIWRLPENARIVAAGNEMADSLAANQLAEPLFNRFAHVYIKTTTESWLKWASMHNIHPAIYAYIAYKRGETLRSKYDGKKPNADPRKWEMASKMLYKTGNPHMLRSLVGEDITREFVEFCKIQVITLEDVINDNYDEDDINQLDTAEKYATVMALSQVDENNLEKVRSFSMELGKEFGKIFDALWTHGDEGRLERIAEEKLKVRSRKKYER